MTVLLDEFTRVALNMPMTPMRRAQLAGQLIAACAELDSPFRGEIGGWRVVVERVRVIRQGVPEDLGLESLP